MHKANYLASRLSRAGSTRLNKTFITHGKPGQQDPGEQTTFSRFFENAAKSARLLSKLGVKPDDNVLVYAPKSVGSIELYFGCLLAGAVYTPVNPAVPADDIGYFVDDARPSLIITDDARMRAAFAGKPDIVPVLTLNEDETGSFIDQRNQQDADFTAVERRATDAAAILYTSGTTGRPKGVIHTHGSLWSNAEVLTRLWKFDDSDVLIHALPIFHLHGLFTAMNVLLASGASCIFLPRFDTDTVLSLMPRSTVLMGVPPFYMSLLDDPRLTDASPTMRVFISGSAPMLPQTHAAWHEKTGKMILERYGMTECSMIASNPYVGQRKPNSVGFPLEGTEIRITDMKTKAPLPNGEIGMIEIRGPNLFKEYFKKPEKTAEDMREDGFFISGDFGRYDDEGYLYVLGRVKDGIFTTDGVVIPKEVEELIDAEPGVAESAVISVPHPDQGNVPVAIIVGTAVDSAAIEAALRRQLPAYKVPVRYIQQDALPRNAMGKVEKAELRATNADLFKDSLVA